MFWITFSLCWDTLAIERNTGDVLFLTSEWIQSTLYSQGFIACNKLCSLRKWQEILFYSCDDPPNLTQVQGLTASMTFTPRFLAKALGIFFSINWHIYLFNGNMYQDVELLNSIGASLSAKHLSSPSDMSTESPTVSGEPQDCKISARHKALFSWSAKHDKGELLIPGLTLPLPPSWFWLGQWYLKCGSGPTNVSRSI